MAGNFTNLSSLNDKPPKSRRWPILERSDFASGRSRFGGCPGRGWWLPRTPGYSHARVRARQPGRGDARPLMKGGPGQRKGTGSLPITDGKTVMTNRSIATEAPSPGAERMRRHRWLRRQGAIHVSFLVGADAIASLVELGWLASADRANRDAVRGAVVRVATHALGLGPTR